MTTALQSRSLAWEHRELSRRWIVDAQCKRLGWVMVPCGAGEDLTNIIADAFDALERNVILQKLRVHESLLTLIESLEESLIVQTCDLTSGWRKTRITRWEQARVEIVTNARAVEKLTQLLQALFERMHVRITDYSLIDAENDKDKLVFLELERLEEKVTEDVIKLAKGWT